MTFVLYAHQIQVLLMKINCMNEMLKISFVVWLNLELMSV